jgi:AcrR family transcriptional regulator
MVKQAREAQAAQRGGRPKSEEKARAILEAAKDLFLAQGLHGTSMDAVAREAGVSKQTVYGHYESKETLFRACIRSKIEEFGFQEEGLPGSLGPRALLLAVCRRFMALVCDPDVVAMYRVVIAEAVSHPRIAELFFESGPVATKSAVSAVLGELSARGELRPHDPDYASWQLFNLCFGHIHTRLLFGLIREVPPEELEQQVGRAVDDFLVLYEAGRPGDGTAGVGRSKAPK